MAVRKRSRRFSAASEASRPVCPDHNLTMTYEPENDRWVCAGAFGCKKVARKQRLFSDIFFGTQNAPAIYRGNLEVVKMADGSVYLSLTDAHAVVDVTAILKEAEEDS